MSDHDGLFTAQEDELHLSSHRKREFGLKCVERTIPEVSVLP
jgi:hypothetical protein